MSYPVVKRAMDIVCASLLLIVVAPVLLLVAVAIRIDSPGPVIFAQRRTGKDGRQFRMLKFRTMVQNAEELKATLAHLSIVAPPDFKIIDDPRITRVGKVLRRTSLDELPQLLNVLLGEMSLVGPRPTSFSPDSWDLWHTARLDVRPGLTGLWQVSGRNTTDFDQRLRLDLDYVRRMSLGYDLRILLRTFGAVVRASGA